MFKYDLSKAEPANEVLIEILFPFIFLGGMIAIGKCIQMISDWRQRKKDGAKSPSDKMKEMLDVLSFEKIKKESQDVPDSKKINDPSGRGAHHAVDFKSFMDATSALKAATKVLELSAGKKGTGKNIKALCSRLSDEIPVYNDNGKLIIEFDDSGAVWPTEVWYKDMDGCNAKFWKELSVSIESARRLVSKVDAIINAPTDGVSQDELNDRVNFVNACVLFTTFVYGTFGGYLINLGTLVDETTVNEG